MAQAEFDISQGDTLQSTNDPNSRWRVERIEGDTVHLKALSGNDTRSMERDDLYAQFSKVASA